MDYLVPVFTDCGNGKVMTTGPLMGNVEEKNDYYKSHPTTVSPKTTRVLDVETDLRLYVAYFKIDIGHFVISSRSRRKAYQLATLLRALFSLFYGLQPEDRISHYFLQELKRLPRPDWGEEKMLAEIRELNDGIPDYFGLSLGGGYIVSPDAYEKVPSFIRRAWGDLDIIEALDHALESRFLFCGFMDGGYYKFHYEKDRRLVPQWEMEKSYFENRYCYETAFVAAFKGIERFFGVNQIRKNKIDTILSKNHYIGIRPDTQYTRYHEIFSGQTQHVSYGEMIGHFLDLRNIVAAHGNKNPPEHAKLIEDNVFEIQLFLKELIFKAIYPNKATSAS